ncbi:hypothetical protein CPB83DRAFT_844891 [Crepidotus variabilis]|uniref:Uncharacterized protein n=1 Tax=Crepidotus variabilis TaxID=179855 RepID=A0A9P6EQ49_9AGAR|nr:hypothetical protein CPB83DRAFT_844891 [Crepidotus variabilis]
MPGRKEPADWKIIETSPSGLELTFYNTKTEESTFYIPDGFTATDVLNVPGAKKYWHNVADVTKYMKQMEVEKAQDQGE